MKQPKSRLPIGISTLPKDERPVAGRDNGNTVMLWVAVSLCFLRSGEITIITEAMYDVGAHLSFGEIAINTVKSPPLLRVRLKASKSDPTRSE